MTQTELYHYGILGMKWGIRRYQNKNGTLTSAGKKRYSSDSSTSEKNTENIEATKARILSSRDPKQLYKNANLFSDQELQAAYIRLNTEKNIKNLIPKDVNAGKKFIDGAIKAGKTTNEAIETATKLWENYKKVQSILDSTKKTAK